MSSEPRIFDPDEQDDAVPEAELLNESWETAELPDDLLFLADQLRSDATRLHESHRADRLQRELLRPERAQTVNTPAPRGLAAWLPLLWLLPVLLVVASLTWYGPMTNAPAPASPEVADLPRPERASGELAPLSSQTYPVSLPANQPSQQGPSAAELDALLDLMENETNSVAVSL
ncbi:MAG: hypothetical protein ACIALR_04435 [Blastopirellula sp. JB062]